MQDFNVDALEKFVEESSIPVVTVFNNDASNHPFVVKFFSNNNAKVNNENQVQLSLYILV